MRINNMFYAKTFFKHVSVKWAVMNNCVQNSYYSVILSLKVMAAL